MSDTNVSANGSSSDEFQLLDESSMSSEDRQEILSHIDKVVEDNKIPVTRDTFALTPKKRGFLLPVSINVIAALAIGAGFFFSARYFEQRKETMSVETQTYLSAEGRLIAELKKEAETKLRQKDDQISQIQVDLNRIDRERQDLQDTMESRIQEREEELKKALEQQLTLERARLRALGTSADDIESRLADFEKEIVAQHTAEIEQFRTEAEEAIRLKEEELKKTQELTQQILAEAQAERIQLEEESLLREEELVSRYEEEKQALAERTTETEQELESLTEARQQEQLISDQIAGTYSLIKQKLANNLFDDAKQDLTRLQQLLFDPVVESLPTIASRRQADLFIIESLDTLIETRKAGEKEDTSSSLIETANLLDTAQGLVARADTLRANGDFQAAVETYSDALELVPFLSSAYSAVRELELSDRQSRIAGFLESGTSKLDEGNTAGAVEDYRRAVLAGVSGNQSFVGQALDGITGTLVSEREAAVGVKESEIDGLESKLATVSDTASQLQRDLTASRKATESLSSRLAAEESETARQQTRIDELDAEIDNLSTRLLEKTQEATDLTSEVAEKDSDISTLENTVESLNSKISELEGSIEQLSNRILSLEQELAQNESALESALKSIDEKETALESALQSADSKDTQLESVRAELDAKTGELEQLKADLAEVSETVSSAQTAAGSAAEELEAAQAQIVEKENQIAQLQSELTAKTSDLALAQAEIEAQKKKVADAESSYAAAAAREEELIDDLEEVQAQLAEAQAKILELNEALAQSENTIEELTEQVKFKSAAAASVEDLKLAKLRNDYQPYKERVEVLLESGDDADFFNARSVLFDFSKRVSEGAFPGITNLWQTTEDAVIGIETETAFEEGTGTALANILSFLLYIRGESDSPMQSRVFLDSLAETDADYRQAFAEIDELASKAGLSASGVSGFQLSPIGEVTGFSEGVAAVELSPDVTVEIDARVIIRRRLAEGETAIAQGTVTRVENGTAEVEILRSFDTQGPLEGDPVYMEEEI